jgi:hypothetical protein
MSKEERISVIKGLCKKLNMYFLYDCAYHYQGRLYVHTVDFRDAGIMLKRLARGLHVDITVYDSFMECEVC